MRIPAALRGILLFAAAATLPGAASAACTAAQPVDVQVGTPPIEVAFESVPDPVRYAPFPKAMESSLGPGWTINGLTVVKPLVRTQIYTSDTQQDGKACVWPTRVVLSFGFNAPANIYVSSKYRPGTCEFETIRNHENQHVGIHVNTRAKHADAMRAKVEAAVARMGPVAARDVQSGLARIQATVSETVDDAIRDYRVEAGTLSGMIDSTDSYLQLQAQCSNW